MKDPLLQKLNVLWAADHRSFFISKWENMDKFKSGDKVVVKEIFNLLNVGDIGIVIYQKDEHIYCEGQGSGWGWRNPSGKQDTLYAIPIDVVEPHFQTLQREEAKKLLGLKNE